MDEKAKTLLTHTEHDANLDHLISDWEYIAAAVLHRERLLQDLFHLRTVDKALSVSVQWPLHLCSVLRRGGRIHDIPYPQQKRYAWASSS